MREQLKTLVPIVLRLPRYAGLVFALMRDPRVTPARKAALGGAVLYNVSPVDLIPGVVPVLGQLDDVAVLLYTLRLVLNECPAPVAREYLTRFGLSARQVHEDPEVIRRALGQIIIASSRLTGRGLVDGGRSAGQVWGLVARFTKTQGKRLRQAGLRKMRQGAELVFGKGIS